MVLRLGFCGAQQTDVQTLANAELTIDGELTHAALVLFGARSALGRHLAQAEIVFEYRSSEASGPAQDRTEFRVSRGWRICFEWRDGDAFEVELNNHYD